MDTGAPYLQLLGGVFDLTDVILRVLGWLIGLVEQYIDLAQRFINIFG